MHDPQALVGQSLSAKYQVRRLLGRGGMGSVYEGQNIEIGKRVAIKTIDQGHAMSAELATRLRREARAAAAVESNHIVQVFDVGEDPKCGVYMVMEFLSGEDLGARLQREGRLPTLTATNIALQVARALVRAHAAGIVHRDLKPGNVFLTEKEEGGLHVKVVDFGISKLLRDDVAGEQRNITRMGTALGTPQYMSPEQAQGNTNVDHRTDVWALGCLLYEMLAGRAPYEDAATYEMTIVRILTTRPAPLLAVAPWVPPALAQVVDATLFHEWELRTPDAQTFVRQLTEAMQLDPSTGSGRYSALNVPQYKVALDATMPMSGEHEVAIAQARAAVAVIASSASHPAMAVDEAPPVPKRSGSAFLFVGLGALAIALGVGGWLMLSRNEVGEKKPTPAAKPVETAAVAKEADKSDKSDKSEAPVEDKPAAPPSVAVPSTKPSPAPTPVGGKGGKPMAVAGKPAPTAVASASAPQPASSAKTGSGFGGAGVSESY